MRKFKFSKSSLDNLKGVNLHLVRVVSRALEITTIDFWVKDGLRTLQEQIAYKKKGTSKVTTTGRHLTGHAVDLHPVVDGHILLDKDIPSIYFDKIADAMFQAAKELDIKIVWGGNWISIVDKYHFELDRNKYPA